MPQRMTVALQPPGIGHLGTSSEDLGSLAAGAGGQQGASLTPGKLPTKSISLFSEKKKIESFLGKTSFPLDGRQ